MRQLTKKIQDARIARDNDAIKTSLEVRQERYVSACLVSIARANNFAASARRLDLFRETDQLPHQIIGTSTKTRLDRSESFLGRVL